MRFFRVGFRGIPDLPLTEKVQIVGKYPETAAFLFERILVRPKAFDYRNGVVTPDSEVLREPPLRLPRRESPSALP